MKKSLIPVVLISAMMLAGCSVTDINTNESISESKTNSDTEYSEVITNNNISTETNVIPVINASNDSNDGNDGIESIGNIDNNDEITTESNDYPESTSNSSKGIILESMTFLNTDDGDVYCFDGGDNRWDVDNKDGSCYPFKYFTPTYTDASRIDIQINLADNSRTDLFYYGILDNNGDYLYVSSFGETTVTINEDRIPSIYSDGKLINGQYSVELYFNEDIIFTGITLYVNN